MPSDRATSGTAADDEPTQAPTPTAAMIRLTACKSRSRRSLVAVFWNPEPKAQQILPQNRQFLGRRYPE